MTVLEWLQELEEEERIVKVGCVDNTLRDAERLHDDDAVFRPGKGGRQ